MSSILSRVFPSRRPEPPTPPVHGKPSGPLPGAANYGQPTGRARDFTIFTSLGTFKGSFFHFIWRDRAGNVRAVARRLDPKGSLYEISGASGDILGFIQVSESFTERNRLFGPHGEERARLESGGQSGTQLFTREGTPLGRLWRGRGSGARYLIELLGPDPYDRLLLMMYPAVRLAWALRVEDSREALTYHPGSR